MAAQHNDKTTATELVAELASSIQGKVVLVTGVSPKGLGATFSEAIAQAAPAMIILAGRNTEKVAQTAEAVQKAAGGNKVETRILELDLGSLAAVRRAAEAVLSWDDVPCIDVLVNNAGIMGVGLAFSPEGYESQFATNHLGPFLFTNLIMDKMLGSGGGRVINDGEIYNPWRSYGQSKSANMLFSVSLAEKLGSRGLLSLSVHPGAVGTHLGDHLDWEKEFISIRDVDRDIGNEDPTPFHFKTDDEGAATHVYGAFDPSLKDHNGAYLVDSHVADPMTERVKPWAISKVEAEKLWRLSEKLVGQTFRY